MTVDYIIQCWDESIPGWDFVDGYTSVSEGLYEFGERASHNPHLKYRLVKVETTEIAIVSNPLEEVA